MISAKGQSEKRQQEPSSTSPSTSTNSPPNTARCFPKQGEGGAVGEGVGTRQSHRDDVLREPL